MMPAAPPTSTKTGGKKVTVIMIVIALFVIIALIGIMTLLGPKVQSTGQTEDQRVFEEVMGFKLAGDNSPPLKQQTKTTTNSTNQTGIILVLIGTIGAAGSIYYYNKTLTQHRIADNE